MTLEELEEIKKDIEEGISYTDIAMNRGYNKASLVAVLNFEALLLKKYQILYKEKLGSEIIKLENEYKKEIDRLKSKIEKLKSSKEFEEINRLQELEENLRNEISFLNRENINLERKFSKYENSFFSFLIR
jgi:predicted RNase H-like nuclease (RuvC/YqgF family)